MRTVALLALLAALPVRALEITGAVYDEAGNPVAQQHVEARVPVTHAKLAETTTSANGDFVIAGLEAGVVEIAVGEHFEYALAGDFVTVNLWTKSSSDEPHMSGEPSEPCVVRGVVRLDGKPLAHAPVALFSIIDRDAVVDAVVVADEKGAFEVRGLWTLRYYVGIDPSLEGRVRRENESLDVADLTNAREATVDIHLQSAPMLRGRVVDADGKPVRRALMRLVPEGQLMYDTDGPGPRTDAGGRYVFPIPASWKEDSMRLAILLPLHSIVRTKPFTLDEATTPIDITLPRFDAVTMRVSDRMGKPVAGALVGFASIADELPPMAIDARATEAGDDGQLVLHLASGTYDFSVLAPHFQARHWSAAAARKIDVVLDHAALVSGRVHRGDRGIGGVAVSMVGEGPKAETDADGRFEIDGLAPGTIRLIFADEDEWVQQTIEMQAPGEADVALPPTGTLKLRVVDAQSGETINPYYAFVVPESYGTGAIRPCESEDGTLQITLPAGAANVGAFANDYIVASTDTKIDSGETTPLEIRLSRGATITGSVVDERGDPVNDAALGIMFDDTRQLSQTEPAATSAEDGTFRMTGIKPGPATITVIRAGFVPFRKSIVAADDTTLDVRLETGLTLRGIVVRDDKPVPEATVSAATSAVEADQNGITDKDGRFTLTGLTPTHYSVTVESGGATTHVPNVDPASNRELVISLDERPHGLVYGSVAGYVPPQQPGRNLRQVVIAQKDDEFVEGAIDPAGNYRIEAAPLGTVSVVAYVEQDARNTQISEEQEVEVRVGEPVRVDLQIAGDVLIRGSVRMNGKMLAGAEVTAYGEGMQQTKTTTDGDGAFALVLPHEGVYAMRVTHELAHMQFESWHELRASDRLDLDLTAKRVEGTVVDAITHQPIRYATINIAHESGVSSLGEDATTDAGGRFDILAPQSGDYRLVAKISGYAPATLKIEGTDKRYLFELTPVGELRIRVSDAHSGAPLEAQLTLVERDGDNMVGDPERYGDGSEFRYWIAPGKYTLRVDVEGYASRELEVTAPGVVDVAMQ
jgi:protocatechuate 3,4-dioxygenase beta subunit